MTYSCLDVGAAHSCSFSRHLAPKHVDENLHDLITIASPLHHALPLPHTRAWQDPTSCCLHGHRHGMYVIGSHPYHAKAHVRHTVRRDNPQRDSIDGSIELVRGQTAAHMPSNGAHG